MPLRSTLLGFALVCIFQTILDAAPYQTGELLEGKNQAIAAQARLRGDARRGALLFYKSAAACAKCHVSDDGAGDEGEAPLGPNLSTLKMDDIDAESIVTSILEPSKVIRKGYETVSVLTSDGQVYTGLKLREDEQGLTLRDASNPAQPRTIPKSDIEEVRTSTRSLMPEGLADSFREERDMFDLVRYVTEIVEGGPGRAAELKPTAEQLLVVDDTQNLDHAGILRSLDTNDMQAGQQIYMSDCKQCHGDDGNTPTLPTARAFGTQPLKYGADPFAMLNTLTRGAGLMTPMQHLSPRQRYQVIHYIREQLMRDHNEAYRPVDETYLSSLPKGTSDGEPTIDMSPRDYGPVLASQIGSQVNHALTFASKDGITASYDVHRMRATAWDGGFLDLSETQHYRQRGEGMPQMAGELIAGLDTWGWLYAGSYDIPQDAKPPRGPLRSDWLQYKGHYLYGDQAVLSYAIEKRSVLESIQAERVDGQPVLQHSLWIDAGTQPLELCVGSLNPQEQSVLGFEVDGQLMLGGGNWADAAGRVAVVSGSASAQPEKATMANRALHMVAGAAARELDLGTPGRTIVVRFRTTGDGTLVASAPEHGRWKPNGKTLFIRGNRLVFDIGWVGAMTGKSNVCDGNWHTAALVVDETETRLVVDGRLEAKQDNFRRDPEGEHVLKIGATATDFGGDFGGEIAAVEIYPAAWTNAELKQWDTAWGGATRKTIKTDKRESLFEWQPGSDTQPSSKLNADSTAPQPVLAATVIGDVQQCQWRVEPTGRIVLKIPASDQPRVLAVVRGSSTTSEPLDVCHLVRTVASSGAVIDPSEHTRGGPQRWPQLLEMPGVLGESINGYALDTIRIPPENPWNAWLRTSAHDFLSDGRAVVTTHGGDVYLVSGIDDSLDRVTWKRYAAGLFEPFGVRVLDDVIYVTCRDGIKRLHDYNQDDEADFIEAFWNDDDVSSMFHAYNFDLQSDSQGNLYFAKAGQYTQHHRPGTIMRIGPAGGTAEVVAWGLRTPNGMGKLADDRFTVSDNQGPWMPAGKISLIEPGAFLGNMPINDAQTEWLKAKHGGKLPESFDQPIVWTPQELDNSCGGQVWVDDPRFGPLSGRLIHSSFGKGWLYYMSLQEIDGQTQASIVALPHQWDAGVMRLRVNPADGQLYGTGLSGWQGPAGGGDGCLQRLRYAGAQVQIVDQTQVVEGGIELRFSFDVDPQSISDPAAWQVEMWDYLWSGRYGSDQFSVLRPGKKGRDSLDVAKIEQIDSRTVRLLIPKLKACDQLWLQMNFLDQQGERYIEQLYLTIHAMPGANSD